MFTPRHKPYHAVCGWARPAWRGAVAALVGIALWAPSAAAEPPPARLSVGAGYAGALLGPPRHGPVFYAAALPGGGFGRLGAHAELRGLDGRSPWWALAGVTYEAGAARPWLKVETRAEAGAAVSEGVAIVGGGARWHVWLWGPLAVGADGAAHLWVDGVDSELLLSAGLTVGVAL